MSNSDASRDVMFNGRSVLCLKKNLLGKPVNIKVGTQTSKRCDIGLKSICRSFFCGKSEETDFFFLLCRKKQSAYVRTIFLPS